MMYRFWIRLRQRKFNKEEWETDLCSRKYFYRDIIESRLLIGNSVYESGRMLGTKNREVHYRDSWKLTDLRCWKYILYKNICNGNIYSLVLYFKNGSVYKVSPLSE